MQAHQEKLRRTIDDMRVEIRRIDLEIFRGQSRLKNLEGLDSLITDIISENHSAPNDPETLRREQDAYRIEITTLRESIETMKTLLKITQTGLKQTEDLLQRPRSSGTQESPNVPHTRRTVRPYIYGRGPGDPP